MQVDQLREAGYRIRLLLVYCDEAVQAKRARHRNRNAEALVERQREVIDQAALQAAKRARVELLDNRKGPPLRHPVPGQACVAPRRRVVTLISRSATERRARACPWPRARRARYLGISVNVNTDLGERER